MEPVTIQRHKIYPNTMVVEIEDARADSLGVDDECVTFLYLTEAQMKNLYFYLGKYFFDKKGG